MLKIIKMEIKELIISDDYYNIENINNYIIITNKYYYELKCKLSLFFIFFIQHLNLFTII
jgi:hypothetical protein